MVFSTLLRTLECLDLLLELGLLFVEIADGFLFILIGGLSLLNEALSLLEVLLYDLFESRILILEALDLILECSHCAGYGLGLCGCCRCQALLVRVLLIKSCN